MINVGDILSIVQGYHEYRGGIFMSTVEGVQYCGVTQMTKIFSPRYWTPPWYSWYPPTCIMISSHGTEHPYGTAHTLYRVFIAPQVNLYIISQLCSGGNIFDLSAVAIMADDRWGFPKRHSIVCTRCETDFVVYRSWFSCTDCLEGMNLWFLQKCAGVLLQIVSWATRKNIFLLC